MAVVITEETMGHVKKIKAVWVSAADGSASGQTAGVYTGEVIRLVTIPATAPNAPSDNYNLTVLDGDSTDVLMDGGLLRDTANTEQVLASSLGCVANDRLTFTIANAGNAKGGTAIVYIK